MSAAVVRGDARRLPLPDASVDLIVTSPPYWKQRDYQDAGESLPGQIGNERTWQEYIANLAGCTREWARVLKPVGSLFVIIGDKYDARQGAGPNAAARGRGRNVQAAISAGNPKSLLGLPWRYALACTDQLGLILRRDIIWNKPNGLPESVTDRCRSSHEYLFHLVKQPRYYAAVDEIREDYSDRVMDRQKYVGRPAPTREYAPANRNDSGRSIGIGGFGANGANPLGKLPGSVWEIPSAPLAVPPHLGIDHFAAFPPALVRPVVLGWSPPGICVACGEGRRPVSDITRVKHYAGGSKGARNGYRRPEDALPRMNPLYTITGYVCACTPYTDHPGTGGTGDQRRPYSDILAEGRYPSTGVLPGGSLQNRERVGPWREYHQWTAPPTRPAVVLDPFCGTGTTMLVASVYGRTGIGVDLSMDYTRLARWRVNDPGERARALDVPKPPKQLDGQDALFEVPG